MMKKVLIVTLLFSFSCVHAQKKLTVFANKIVAPVSPTMWGIFFEDINFGADGGLYAELVKNRSFEFNMPLAGWTEQNSDKFSTNLKSGSVLIMNRAEKASNPRFAHVTVNADKGY